LEEVGQLFRIGVIGSRPIKFSAEFLVIGAAVAACFRMRRCLERRFP